MVAPHTETLLDVRHVNVDYLAGSGAVHAVRDVSFQLKRGEIMGLAGESGSGKSTLAFAIARLLRPPAEIIGGQVLYYPDAARTGQFTSLMQKVKLKDASHQAKNATEIVPEDGINVFGLTPTQLRLFRWNELSVVFQSAMNALNPVMNIGKQIMDVLAAHQPEKSAKERHERAQDLLKMVGIAPDRLSSYPHELSGGMRQRVTIAIALALQPDLIIMDEPTTALDVVVQREILDLISSLCKETGTALIFITHDLSLLLELVDRVAVMYAGKLIEVAGRNAFYQHPRHPYSYGLMHSFPTLHGPRIKMIGIPGTPPDLRNVPAGCPFAQRCPMAFDACRKIVPELRTIVADIPEQVAACHLYDPTIIGSRNIPQPADLAKGFEVKPERSVVR
ncbi:ABC transporter ATP-binding protein [Dictyobacter arantiisoli]|uniref:Dipeptide/oligopeptide/nickel ABC transporter ATP-binding protein n=1 Tax=Dictyobacter arantiisoli TaxID=2014874 RepID=A0A5A5TBQ6_9CHLR|nr:ABC transporter ATP-binding protein [Dictyobacter arantiisoli]GCF08453.1 dipeptide/oligopeptide/nickel ABC transporter ATP-binding protein [Dictyobacter arantiisoli]